MITKTPSTQGHFLRRRRLPLGLSEWPEREGEAERDVPADRDELLDRPDRAGRPASWAGWREAESPRTCTCGRCCWAERAIAAALEVEGRDDAMEREAG
ncbi:MULTISPECIES: hypothetical protein [unclassified Actinobaculum]|uniref:hypothetical protein n=1 Tax=unclassified Actinobaculum TaxID=2609299 RepID=UPI000D526678|nr:MULTISPECIES: hypothetical protein [unclassified Actinobaculum]AWE41936.1 hypothetical protein DDD63_03270 [Actinobaculum sp. 313]RTE50147.1 hypothetical protein EKN07_02690 [Actinobaculum sp. 352]